MSATECARCGDCCDPVTVGFHVETWAPRRLLEPDLSAESRENCEFMLAHWTTVHALVQTDDENVIVGYQVRCDAFNPTTRLCEARETRPPVCRDFPWYDREPGSHGEVAASLSPRCSFNADVPGRRMLPLTVVTR